VNATDKDTGRNALIKYSLHSPKGVRKSSRVTRRFWIDQNTGVVYTNGSFSHRIGGKPFVQMIVVATDSGTPARSSQATLWIEIRPLESDTLKFSNSKYT